MWPVRCVLAGQITPLTAGTGSDGTASTACEIGMHKIITVMSSEPAFKPAAGEVC